MSNVFNSIAWILKGQGGTAATLQTLVARSFVLLLNVATGIITARALGPQGRGEQSAMILWCMFLANMLTLGLPSALVYNFKRYPEERQSFFAAALSIGTVAGLAAIVVGVVCMPSWLPQYSIEVIRYAQWFMIFAPIVLAQSLILSVLEALGDFTASNLLRLLIPSITLVCLMGLNFTNTLTPFTSSLTYTLNGLPVFAWTLLRLLRLLKPRWHRIGVASKRLLSYGLRAYGMDLLGALALQVDQVLVVGFLEPVAMGIYVVALSLSRMLNVLQASIVAVLFPKVAACPTEEVVALTGRSARLSTAMTLLAALVVAGCGPWLLQLFYGSEYLAATGVLRLLVIETVLSGTTLVLTQAFMALGKPGIVTILQAVGLGISVLLMLVLIPAYGLIGAGIALLGASIARLLLTLACYPFGLKVRPPNLLITLEDLRYLKSRLLRRN